MIRPRTVALLLAPILAAAHATGQQNVTIAAVNPPERLTGTVLGEWNTDSNLENWSGSHVTGLSATGGVLAGSDTTPSADSSLTLAPLTGGPDLDFGFFDYLQIRLKLPAAYTGDVRFDYGTSTRNGFDAARRFVIPAASIIKNGQFHTYRLDLGLDVFWRDSLRDLRITPIIDDTGGFEIDYIELGDIPGTAPALNLATNFIAPLNADNTSRLESKHFCIWWDPNNTAFTLTHARRALRMNEESYQVFVKKLGYNEPFRTFDSDTTPRYKINHITWHGGFWAGGWSSRGHMSIGVSGLLDEGWGNPVPHEFAHVIQMGQFGRMVGGHWESHANYLRARRNLHFFDVIPGVIPAIDNLTGNSNYRPDHKRFIYHDQRYYLPLDDFGTNFGLPADFTASVWRDGPRDRTLIEKIAAMLPPEVSVKDVAAEACKHWPMLDFVEKDRIRQQHWGTTANRLLHFWRQGAQLIPLQDKPGWWRVPPERAPDSWGYQMHVLDATPGSTITTELRGIDKAGTGEDWRWCFAAITPGDNVRYSPVHPPGTQSFTLNPDESQVFLIVTATTDEVLLDLDENYSLGAFNGTTNATEVWSTQSLSPTVLVAVQNDGTTRHLAQGWASGSRGAGCAVTPIPQGEKGVYHFRIRTTTGTPDTTFGLSDIPSGTTFSFGDFEAQVFLIGNAGTIELGARNGGSYQSLTTGLATNTWYDLWLVIDNGADTYDVHFGSSGNPNTPGPRLAKGLGFRNGNAANPLGTFLTLSNPQADLATHLDDIHYSADAAHIAEITILADIGTDAANGNNQNTSTLAAAQLNAITGVTGAIAENETAYQIYISGNPSAFGYPATTAQVQAMIDDINSAALASVPLAVTELGFNPLDGFDVSVSGLNPARTYRLMRSADLNSFSTEVDRKQPSTASDIFTDPNPPEDKAFYRLEPVSETSS
jgi:hypothetical protein